MVTRIRQLLDWQQLSPTQFADLIGVGRPVVSHILSERNKPSLEVVQRIIAAFPAISLPWLLSGTGEMLPAARPETTSTPATTSVSSSSAAVRSPRPPAPPIATSAATHSPSQPTQVPPASTARRPAALAPARFAVARPPLVTTAPAATPPTPPTPAAEPAPVPVVPADVPVPRSEPAAGSVAPQPAPEPEAAPASADLLPATPTVAGAALPFLGEPGKAIRRIVIFYRDGSFADYLPEA